MTVCSTPFPVMLFLFIYGINRQISACEPPPKGGEDFYLTTLAEMIFLIDKCIIVVVSLQVVSFIKLRLAIKLRLCSAAKGVTEFREWQIAQCRVCFCAICRPSGFDIPFCSLIFAIKHIYTLLQNSYNMSIL